MSTYWRHRSPRFHHSGLGFTFIELVAVLFVLSLAVWVVFPRLPATEAATFRRSAGSLAATIRYLTDQAVTAKICYRLNFHLTEGQVSISRIDAGGGEAAPQDVFLSRRILNDDVRIKDVELSRQGKIAEGEVMVDFGLAGLKEFLIVHLQGPRNTFFTILAFPESSKVKVVEGYQEIVL